jgi:hypothetical protein
MISKATISRHNVIRKALVCFALTAIVILTFASSGGGGGDKDKNRLNLAKDFTTIRTSGGFTLKAGPLYGGSQLLNMQKQRDVVVLSSVVTYQKGNTTFILPYKYRMAKPSAKSNLNAFDVKINLHK